MSKLFASFPKNPNLVPIEFMANADIRDSLSQLQHKFDSFMKQNQKWIVLENNSLRIRLKDGSWGVVDFETRNNHHYMFDFFLILYRQWVGNGEKTALSKGKMTEELMKQGVEEGKINNDFLDSTKSNINKKIKGKGLSNVILIRYVPKKGGYSLYVNKQATFFSRL